MKDPEEALAAARAAARDEQELPRDAALTELSPASARRLARWALIEPEQAEVYSTRRLGKPITGVKRLLVRLLSQYIGQVSAQQSRFNAAVAAHLIQMEERLQALEQAAADRDQEPPAS